MRYIGVLCLGFICALALAEEEAKTKLKKSALPKKFVPSKEKPNVPTEVTTAASVIGKNKEEVVQNAAQSATLDKASVSEILVGSPKHASIDDEDDKFTRKKKSATTTFCVEIRPSGPYQKPFQVCEPDYKYAAAPVYALPLPQVAYSSGSSYGGQPTYAPTPVYSKSNYAPYPAAISSTSVSSGAISFNGGKTSYTPPSAPSYPTAKSANPSDNSQASNNSPNAPTAAAYSAPSPYDPASSPAYGQIAQPAVFRAEDGSDEESEPLSENEELQTNDSPNVRSTGHDDESGYGYDYGGGYGGYPSHVTYVTHVKPKKYKLFKKDKKEKDKDKEYGHNGLVITCQPSLAGYASSIPHYESDHGYGGHSYGGGYGRSYSNPGSHSKSIYDSPPHSYHPPTNYGTKPVYGNSYDASYAGPSKPISNHQAYAPHYGKPYNPPTPQYESPYYSEPVYSEPHHPVISYGSPYNAPPPQLYPSKPYEKPIYYKPNYPPPKYNAPAYPAPSYAAPVYHASNYHPLPPPYYSEPYRSVENNQETNNIPVNPPNKMGLNPNEKQKHTLHHMQDISKNRIPTIKVDGPEITVTNGEIMPKLEHGKKVLPDQANNMHSGSLSVQPLHSFELQSSNFKSSGWSGDMVARNNVPPAESQSIAASGGWGIQARFDNQQNVQNPNLALEDINSKMISKGPDNRQGPGNPSILQSGWNSQMSGRAAEPNGPSNLPQNISPMSQQNQDMLARTSSNIQQAGSNLSPSGGWKQESVARESQNAQSPQFSSIVPNTGSNKNAAPRIAEFSNVQQPNSALSGGWGARSNDHQHSQIDQKSNSPLSSGLEQHGIANQKPNVAFNSRSAEGDSGNQHMMQPISNLSSGWQARAANNIGGPNMNNAGPSLPPPHSNLSEKPTVEHDEFLPNQDDSEPATDNSWNNTAHNNSAGSDNNMSHHPQHSKTPTGNEWKNNMGTRPSDVQTNRRPPTSQQI